MPSAGQPRADGTYDGLVEVAVVEVAEAAVVPAAVTAAVADGGADETDAAAAAGDGEG